MAKILVDNVMKVLDVHRVGLDPNTIQFLQDNHCTYTDNVLKEHLVDVNTALDDAEKLEDDLSYIKSPEIRKTIKREMRQLDKVAIKNDCGYVRFIN